jgi:amino acid transporter
MAEVDGTGGIRPNLTEVPPALKRELRLPGVLMQSIGTMAPAASVVFTIQFLAVYAGMSVPGALLVAMVIMASLALTLSQIAKLLPSSGGYYTFVRSAFGPSAGLGVAILVLIYLMTPSMNSGYLSTILQSEINSSYSVNIAWPIWFVVIILSTGFLAYRGISISGRTLLILGGIEITILLVLATFGFASPGAGGASVGSLNPFAAHSGLYLAVVFGMFFFAGWEGAAPVAEESIDPKRTLPRALVGSVIGIGIVFIFTSWGLMSGWGSSNLKGFVNLNTIAPFTLAHHYWGGLWWLLLLALFNSVMAISLASTLICTRMIYALARIGVLPKFFATLHPKHRTPMWATLFSVVLSLLLGLALGGTEGPENSYFIYGLAFTLLICVVYVAGNFAVTRYIHQHHRSAFKLGIHVILPLLTSAAVVYVGYRSVIPFPAYPTAAGAWVAVGWVLVAAVVAVAARNRSIKLDADLFTAAPVDVRPGLEEMELIEGGEVDGS